VVEGIDLTGKQAIVTGGASGIGVETARALAGARATVTIAVRRTGEGEVAAEGMSAEDGRSHESGSASALCQIADTSLRSL
jgi:NAD(P)-dependent dehydrogenase (short-subunit alcohol dehydrogenase family)